MKRFPRSWRVLLPLLFVPLWAGCSGERPAVPAAGESHANTGRIRGVVRLAGDAPDVRTEPVEQDTTVCGSSVSVRRIAIGADNGIRNAFVYLDGVKSQEKPAPRLAVPIDQKQCQYEPHVLTVPTGSQLEIVNSDPILHNVHAKTSTENGLQTLFNIAQPVRGQKTAVEPRLTKPGIVMLACEAGHPWMNAYVFVADHPFVASTDDAGEFLIADVPAGTYPIRMWHEGVTLKTIYKSLQRYEYEDPYEVTKEVIVSPGKETVVEFGLSLRANP